MPPYDPRLPTAKAFSPGSTELRRTSAGASEGGGGQPLSPCEEKKIGYVQLAHETLTLRVEWRRLGSSVIGHPNSLRQTSTRGQNLIAVVCPLFFVLTVHLALHLLCEQCVDHAVACEKWLPLELFAHHDNLRGTEVVCAPRETHM